jgi:hypothetical protein
MEVVRLEDEQIVIEITELKGRMKGVEENQKTLFKRLDDRDTRSATQSFTIVITCVGVIANLIILLAKK